MRAYADKFAQLYKGTIYSKYSERISGCSNNLDFITLLDADTGETRLKLKSALFCRVPRCPICQWRRSAMWRAKAFRLLPKLFEDYPDARFLFLTLTVRTCELVNLRSTLSDMNAAWQRLSQRKQFPAIGWLKTVEVTRTKDDLAHPHFHCLLMVRPSYFQGKYYLSKEAWIQLWQKSLRVDYSPSIDIQAVKVSCVKDDLVSSEANPIIGAVLETFKYSVKPEEMVNIDDSRKRLYSNQEWLVELTAQLYKTKSLATGGILKDYLKTLEDEPEDLINADDLVDTEDTDKSNNLMFMWDEYKKRYIMRQ
jgi:plasmid rolling circle replication initiator protein Rep